MFTGEMDMYVGKQLERLNSIWNSGRNLKTDNWFTSVPIASILLLDYKLTAMENFFKVLWSSFSTRLFFNVWFWQKFSLVSYITRSGKIQRYIAWRKLTQTLTEKTNCYFSLQGKERGSLHLDRLCAKYDVARNIWRCTIVSFYRIWKTLRINSQITY